MDPFTAFHSNSLRDNITRDLTELISLFLEEDNYATWEHIQQLENRSQGIPLSVLEIKNFTFTVPEHSLEEIFTWNSYTRPKPMIHYRVENKKNYYNANEAYLTYQDPDTVAFIAQATAEENGNNDQNQLQRIYNQAKKTQMERNIAAKAEVPDWVLCQRTEENDNIQEDIYIRYTDETKQNIDWYTTIHNLHDMGRRLGYTHRHYHDAMTRFVSLFKPSLSSLITNLDANEIAQFLMSMNIPVPEKQKHFKAIKALHRGIGTKLRDIMYELHINAKGYYADKPEVQRNALINKMMIKGLQALTAGDTNIKLRASIQEQIFENQSPTWERILEAAILSEEDSEMPTTVLHFLPNNQIIPVQAMPLFNITAQRSDPFIQQSTPLIPPLVNDGQFQSTVYTNEDKSQLLAHNNAYFIQQNSTLHIQPNLQQNNRLAEELPVKCVADEQELQYSTIVPQTETAGSPIVVAPTVTTTIPFEQIQQISKDMDKLKQAIIDSTVVQSTSLPSVPCSTQSYCPDQRQHSISRQNYSHKRHYQHEDQCRFRSRSPPYKKYRWNSPDRYSRSNSPRENCRQNQQKNRRSHSPSLYKQNMPQYDGTANLMILGVNCNPNYTKSQGQLCTKCNSYGKHEEPACPHYYRWSPLSCATCHSGMHDTSECLKNRQTSPNRRSPAPNNESHQKN